MVLMQGLSSSILGCKLLVMPTIHEVKRRVNIRTGEGGEELAPEGQTRVARYVSVGVI